MLFILALDSLVCVRTVGYRLLVVVCGWFFGLRFFPRVQSVSQSVVDGCMNRWMDGWEKLHFWFCYAKEKRGAYPLVLLLLLQLVSGE